MSARTEPEHRAADPTGRDDAGGPAARTDRVRRPGFGRLVWAEWTKLRSVPAWLVGLAVAALLTAAIGLLICGASVCSRQDAHGREVACTATVGPDGRNVTDRFYFVHRPMTGDGSLTVRLTALDASQPWAKAGIMVKDGIRPGAGYAAVLVTPGHGARLQDDFAHDVAGPAGTVSPGRPRWLRLTRAGDRLTGAVSPDGHRWTTVGTARLTGLPRTAQVGLFAATPLDLGRTDSLTQSTVHPEATVATATFDRVRATGGAAGTAWTGTRIGDTGPLPAAAGGYHRDGDTLTVRGSGDIAPAVSSIESITPVERTLLGSFAGLVAIAVVAISSIGTEYRRGTIRLTLLASPRRGRVLAAKALVVGGAVFLVGLATAAVAVALGTTLLRANGNVLAAVPPGTVLRVVVGTAALLAVAAVLALAVGAIVRHAVGAIVAVLAGLILPYLLAAVLPVLPAPAAEWLLRVSPAAGFAVQQTMLAYPQVDAAYTPFDGYYPLAPWQGFAVLCGWALLALAVATLLLRRRDA